MWAQPSNQQSWREVQKEGGGMRADNAQTHTVKLHLKTRERVHLRTISVVVLSLILDLRVKLGVWVSSVEVYEDVCKQKKCVREMRDHHLDWRRCVSNKLVRKHDSCSKLGASVNHVCVCPSVRPSVCVGIHVSRRGKKTPT